MDKEQYSHAKRMHRSEADLLTTLECFGDELAKRKKYRGHRGIDAIRFFLIQQHHWLPSTVRAFNWEDLRFLLEEEMGGWAVPDEWRPKRRSNSA